MSDRGKEIEAFYWLLMRLAGVVFGWLMIIGGGLMALAFFFEQMRTGVVAVNGREYADWTWRTALVAMPAAVAVAGAWLIRISRRGRNAGRDENNA